MLNEKSVSVAQQKAAGLALAAKRGEVDPSKLEGPAKEMMKMSEKDLEDFAKTKHKGLPMKREENNLEEAAATDRVQKTTDTSTNVKAYRKVFDAAMKKFNTIKDKFVSFIEKQIKHRAVFKSGELDEFAIAEFTDDFALNEPKSNDNNNNLLSNNNAKSVPTQPSLLGPNKFPLSSSTE